MSIESKIKQNVPLAQFTTFQLGGPAKFFVEIISKEDLIEIYQWAQEKGEKIYILGGGSNILINDNGVDGVVIKFKNDNIQVRGVRLDMGAGANLIRAARQASGSSLVGLEWATGIPGATIGGAVRGNAGAFGHSIEESFETAEVLDVEKLKFTVFSNKDCKFYYRGSIFKENDNFLIWNVVLKLSKGQIGDINDLIDKYSLNRDKNQPKSPSAGCIFKNIRYSDLKKVNEHMAEKAIDKGLVKGNMVPAGWLIDHMGLKGKAIGGAKISLEHANFIINTGGACTEDVVVLISFIKQQIRTRLKIQLQEEVQYLGF